MGHENRGSRAGTPAADLAELDGLIGRASRGEADVVELPGRTPAAADLAELEKLIGRSSLGAPDAVELRSRTPAQLVERVAQRCEVFSGLGHDLAGLAREKADLRSADLRDADLRDARLRGADLRHADLSGADLSGVQLDRANLGNANLAGAILLDASLIRTHLRETNLDGAALTRAALDHARLVGATMCHATLYRSSLRHAIIGRTDLTGTYLSKACLDDALIMESILRECEFSDATLRRTRIVRVDLASCVGLVPVQLVESDVGVETILPSGWAAELWPQSHLDGVVPAPWVQATHRWQSVGSSELAGRWPSHDYAERPEPEQTSRPGHTVDSAAELYQDSGVDFARTGSKPHTPPGSGSHQNTVVPPRRPPTTPLARSPSRPRTDVVRPARHARHQRKGRHRAVGQTTGARLGHAARILSVLAAIVAAFTRILGGVQPPPHPDIQPTMAENSSFEHEMSMT